MVFLVFESSSIEAIAWASEGCDFTRAETPLALWPFPSKTQGSEAEAPPSLMVSLAGRAQAKGLSSESRTRPIYLRVGWYKAKAWPVCPACAWPGPWPAVASGDTGAATLGGAHLVEDSFRHRPRSPFPAGCALGA